MSGRKGRYYENEFAKKLEERGWSAKVTGYDQAANISDHREPDVKSVIAGVPFCFEVKFRKAMTSLLWSAVEQAQAAAKGNGSWPAVILRTRRRPHLVVMELDDFLELIEHGCI